MSWSVGAGDRHGIYYLNDVEISRTEIIAWQTKQGKFSPAQMLTDQYHTIKIQSTFGNPYAYAGLALLYTVP
jgi:hypothetical protein